VKEKGEKKEGEEGGGRLPSFTILPCSCRCRAIKRGKGGKEGGGRSEGRVEGVIIPYFTITICQFLSSASLGSQRKEKREGEDGRPSFMEERGGEVSMAPIWTLPINFSLHGGGAKEKEGGGGE